MARRLVVIGGDAAAVSAATQVRRMTRADEFAIVAFERSSRTTYAACGLPYLVGGRVTAVETAADAFEADLVPGAQPMTVEIVAERKTGRLLGASTAASRI